MGRIRPMMLFNPTACCLEEVINMSVALLSIEIIGSLSFFCFCQYDFCGCAVIKPIVVTYVRRRHLTIEETF